MNTEKVNNFQKKRYNRLAAAWALTVLIFVLCLWTAESVQAASTVKSISIRGISRTITLGKAETRRLSVSVRPSSAKGRKLTWKSSNPGVVAVTGDGTIKALKTGRARITVKTAGSSSKSAVVTVQVEQLKRDSTRFIAHRGLSALAPENTLAAFRLAGEKGFWGVECDIWETVDGQFVVSHDASLKRMCGVSRNITRMTLEEVRSYPIINGTGVNNYSVQMVPTLEEYLQMVSRYSGLHPKIELKGQMSRASLEKLVELAWQYGLDSRVSFSSVHRKNLKTLQELYPELSLQLIVPSPTASDIRWCSEKKINISIKANYVTAAMVKELHKAGVHVNVWNVASSEKAYALIRDMKVDSITTDACLY